MRLEGLAARLRPTITITNRFKPVARASYLVSSTLDGSDQNCKIRQRGIQSLMRPSDLLKAPKLEAYNPY